MKVIDLLNKIANGEEVPEKIIYKGIVRKFDYEDKDYTGIGNEDYYLFHDTLAEGTGDKMVTGLNDEVEIIEDKKIDNLKLNDSGLWTGKTDTDLIVDKINEIIRVINGE